MANLQKGYYESYLKVLKHGLEIYGESGNVFKDFGNHIYDMLTTVGVLNVSKEAKNKFLDDTKLKILAEAAACKDEHKKVHLMSIVDDNLHPKMHPDLISAVKREIFSSQIKIVIENKATKEYLEEIKEKINQFFIDK